MATENMDISINLTGNAGQELQKLQKNVEKVTDQFNKMKTSLAGLALGAFAISTIKFADSMDDLSKATGVAVNNIVGLTKSFQQNGGDAEQARQAVIKLSLSIADAADGGKDAQLAFQKVGVSLNDLATLSETDILAKTIQGLAKISDTSLRAKTAVELLGKGAKGIDFRGVADGYIKASEEARKYNDAVRAAAELNDKFEAAISKLKMSFLKTFEPIANAINNLDDEQIGKFIESIAQLSVALIAIAASIKTIEALSKAVVGLGAAWAAFNIGVTTASAGLLLLKGNIVTVINILKNIGQLLIIPFTTFSGVLGRIITVFAALFGSAGKLGAAFLMIGKGLLRMIPLVGVITTALWALNEAVAAFTPKSLMGWLSEGVDKLKEFVGLKDKIAEGGDTSINDAETKKLLRQQAEAQKLIELKKKQADREKEVKAYYDKTQKSLEANTEQFRRQGAEMMNNLKLEQLSYLVSADGLDLLRAQNEVYKRMEDEIKKLLDQKAQLKEDETDLAKLYDIEIEKIRRLAGEQATQATEAIQYIQLQKAAMDELNHALDMKAIKIKSDESAKRLTEDLSLIGLYGEELKKQTNYIEAQRELRATLNELQMEENRLIAERTKLGEDNFNREMRQLNERRAAAEQVATDRIKNDELVRKATYENSRSFSQGWKQAYDEYVENGTNAGKRAGEAFRSITSNMESAIDKFVETGKFKFSDFARSIIQDLIKIELKAQATQILKSMGGLGGILGGIGSIFGFAEGGNPPINKPSIVGENGPELFVPKTAGTIIPNGGGNGGGMGPISNTYITNNISAIDAKSVAQLFAENRKTLLGTVQLAQKEMPYGNR